MQQLNTCCLGLTGWHQVNPPCLLCATKYTVAAEVAMCPHAQLRSLASRWRETPVHTCLQLPACRQSSWPPLARLRTECLGNVKT